MTLSLRTLVESTSEAERQFLIEHEILHIRLHEVLNKARVEMLEKKFPIYNTGIQIKYAMVDDPIVEPLPAFTSKPHAPSWQDRRAMSRDAKDELITKMLQKRG